MNCPSCQHENKPSAKFCTRCRTKLQRVCPACGAEYEAQDRFCGECGADLPDPGVQAFRRSGVQERSTSEAERLNTRTPERLNARTPERLDREGENRFVTVLFADMSRSVEITQNLAAEEAAALVGRLLEAMVRVLLKYEGRVDRFLGDGILAVFGTPRAHESDPEGAIRAALEIREAAQQLGLQVTAGINTGEVYYGDVGPDHHREVTVMGPVVNLASRLQGQAVPGQILVGESTYRLTRRAFAFHPLLLTVKGISRPVRAYAVDGLLARPEKVRGIEGLHAELIGREGELTRLQEAVDELLQGRGRTVALIGPAGVGKSRLIAELKQRAVGHRPSAVSREAAGRQPSAVGENDRAVTGGREPTADSPFTDSRQPTADGPLWLEGRCLELGLEASYAPFLDLFRDFFGWLPEELEADRAQRLTSRVQELVARGDLSPAQLEEIVPLLGHLLSVRFGNEWDERLQQTSPQQIKHRTFTAIRDFLLALSRRQPVVLVLEDLHWADSLSLDLTALLMETVAAAPLLLLLIYRPEKEHRCRHLGSIAARKCPEQYTELVLRELSPPQSRRLVDSLLRIDDFPPVVKDAILEKSGGNPFFVEEVVRSLHESGLIYRDAASTHGEAVGAWRAREGIETLTVPESIQSVIQSRVDRLEPTLKEVLQRAAVIGRVFPRRLLEAVVESSELRVESADRGGGLSTFNSQLSTALWELEELALVHQEKVVPEEEYSFQHVLTQETVYQSILSRRRATLHEQVAEALERLYAENLEPHYEPLAHHYVLSGRVEKAVEYLPKAGEKAKRRYANEAAIAYFRKTLELLDRLPVSPERTRQELGLQLSLGAPLIAARGYAAPEVEQAFARARALCEGAGETRLLFPVLRGLWLYHCVRAEHPAAWKLAEELLRLAEAGQDAAFLLAAHLALGTTALWMGELARAREHLDQTIAHYDPQQHRSLALVFGTDPGAVGRSYAAWTLWLLGYPDQALRTGAEAVTMAREVPHPLSLAFALDFATGLHQYRREVPMVHRRASEEIALATEQGFPLWLAAGTVRLGWAIAESGEAAAGIAQMREGLAAYQATGATLYQPYFLSMLASASGKAGRPEEGSALVAEALAAIPQSKECLFEAELYRLRGELLLATSVGNEAEAERCFGQAVEVARRQQAKSLELRAVMSQSRLWQQQGRGESARERLSAVYHWFTEGFDTPDLKEARSLLEELSPGSGDPRAVHATQRGPCGNETAAAHAATP